MRRAASIAARQAAMVQQSQESKSVPSSPKIKRPASAKAGPLASTKSAAAVLTSKPDESTKKTEVKSAAEQVQTLATNTDSPKSEPSAPSLPEADTVDTMAIDGTGDTAEGTEEVDPALEAEETLMEETIRVTRAKLRRRTAAEDSAGN
jgi:receptor expression-enhancing protein 1/2/3/4